jgi:hypothetical protein
MGMEQSAPRVIEADRSQLELRPFDLDSTIPQDHRARLVWRAVESLDLSGFYARIKARPAKWNVCAGSSGPSAGSVAGCR